MNPPDQLILNPILPEPVVLIIGVVALALTVLAYWRVGRGLAPWRNLVLMLFRIAGVALVILLLLQPSREEKLPPPVRDRFTMVAIDTSASMKQRDAGETTRLDAAKELLLSGDVVPRNGVVADPHLRVFAFSDDARPVTGSVLDLAADGKTTRFHKSVTTMMGTLGNGEAANALVLLTDGHDFELVNPAKTGAAARSQHVPIYGVAFGKQGNVRDVAVRIAGYQPYCYVKQKARISAMLRLVGCEYETITVQLLRQGQIVQTKRVNVEDRQEVPADFEVTEPATGQYEYEVRVPPLEGEADTANNSTINYLNVIDQQIRVLVLEGDPYWDTTFLQRSLMRNDKFDVAVLSSYGEGKIHTARKTPSDEPLTAPRTLEELGAYDVIFLGRNVDRLLGDAQVALLDQFVQDRGGTVVFCRGRAFSSDIAGDLEPVVWGAAHERVKLEPTAEGRNTAAFRGGDEDGALPELLNRHIPTDVKPLTTTLAVASGADESDAGPAIVQRRYGRGQVVSIGIEGLWRWELNAANTDVNTAFDRFWDQMILWLLAGRDFVPAKEFSFRLGSANISLGDKVYFHAAKRQPDPAIKHLPLTIYYGEAEAGRVDLARAPGDAPGRFTAEFAPERTGRYRAVATFPDGTTQESRFIVFSENLEETEVATDVVALRRLCESSGGRVIEPSELARLLKELNTERSDVPPPTRIRPVWNQVWVFYLAGLLFGLDWFLRRRWGLT